ncbi:phosphoribosylformylglycinamidine synthase [Struthio camelus]|uniref:phosphoribosylformylglycinamidine synthase n=1 Tax=Struthio camelus TaxID=8801 RepID=UPI003603BF24
MAVLHFYVRPGPPARAAEPGDPEEAAGDPEEAAGAGAQEAAVALRAARATGLGVTGVTCELCYNVAWDGQDPPTAEETRVLHWLFGSPFEEGAVAPRSFLRPQSHQLLLEIGPRLNFSTAASTNAVAVCRAAGLGRVGRLERSRRYLLQFEGPPPPEATGRLVPALSDRMTEQLYPQPVTSFAVPTRPVPVTTIDVLGSGRQALERADRELGLAFDAWDLNYYTQLFQRVGRNPTSVECFDLAQSNSEHSRHWFFKGRLVVDGQELPQSLFESIMDTQKSSNPNNVIKFSDNSSAIRGVAVTALWPQDPTRASPFEKRTSTRHVIFTAETHNFPTAVAPFSGATTGTGGRIRDVQCTGRGAHVIAGTAGYSFGNLLIPGYELPWEDGAQPYPETFARPLEVAIGASDGASDYGNKFGEPVLAGFARSFGQELPGGERREWIKPIMFSGGIGAIEDAHVRKEPPQPGMLVVKVGGPVYRIGVGGGAASSVQVQGDNAAERDAGAVQRGDAEMEQKMNRVLRGCVESGEDNPVCSLHDQGAGGNGNVLKEISEPAGAIIYASRFQLGDPTLSLLEIWGAEYQESNALLVWPSRVPWLQRLAQRERCPLDIVGTITGDGRIVLVDDLASPVPEGGSHKGLPTPVNLELEWVLGKMPRKEFILHQEPPTLRPLSLPPELTVRQALERVLRLPAVASKRYLTNKVDRSVTGLVAQQQCVGPLHTPLADVAVVALSHFDTVGAATALGEQPIKGLLDPAAGARLALTEALTNLVFARITDLRDVKCSGNWMWGGKEGAAGGALAAACGGLCHLLGHLGVALDGGKDSLAMAARLPARPAPVRAPGTLVVSAYAVCPDVTATVTPDLKCPEGQGTVLWVPLNPGRHRLGGSALAQVFSQLGDACPDLEHPEVLAAAFRVTQELLCERVLSAGHDVSDGGLLGCALEMAFAGNCGLRLDVPAGPPGVTPLAVLFAEEPGLLLEVAAGDAVAVSRRYQASGVQCLSLGRSGPRGPQATVRVAVGGAEVLSEAVAELRALWEATSFALERLQAAPGCVAQEEAGLARRRGPGYRLPFEPALEPPLLRRLELPGPRVAVLREEGSNGDREMAAAFAMAGFQVWDMTTEDLCSGTATLDAFRGLVFVGGFSYADVLGSAKGWAAAVTLNAPARAALETFRRRPDTFSLGVCNGCQLLARLGWVGAAPDPPPGEWPPQPGVLLAPNTSGRFESRFVTVRVEPGPAVLLRGMEGAVLGIWVAHGQGRFQFRDAAGLAAALAGGLVALRYVDDEGHPTVEYPLNPNGAPGAVAGLCSPCGRHLALMPHPERAVRAWQWPWWPPEWPRRGPTPAGPTGAGGARGPPGPWLRLFQNACEWCLRFPHGET